MYLYKVEYGNKLGKNVKVIVRAKSQIDALHMAEKKFGIAATGSSMKYLSNVGEDGIIW